MTLSVQVLDRLTTVAPLGLRFRDAVSGTFVGDGLNVSVYPPGRSSASVRAVANRRGVYVVHHAPGLLSLEHGNGDDDFWQTPPPRKSFVIEVDDEQGRFQPFRFTEQLPVRGIYQWAEPAPASPPVAAGGIPLYSSPARTVPAGMAAIRADLWDASLDQAAAWAVLEAYLNNRQIARGVADEAGRIVLIFPYPPPVSFSVSSPPSPPSSSPPAATGPPLTEQTWSIRLRARYTSVRPAASPPDPLETRSNLPDLRFTLSQPEATIWADAARTRPLLEVSVGFGRELNLQSATSTATSPPSATRRSVLFISPAVSPP